MIKSVFFSLLITATASSCNKGLGDAEPVTPQQVTMNVPYGTDAAQKMDVYLPAERTNANTKVLVFIHGGSWSGGDKTEFSEAIDSIRPKLADYAMFNINYRLSGNNNNHYPTQMNDIQQAIDFIKSKSAEYMINPDKIGLIGASAGGHLALLQAYKFNTDGKIKAVIDLFGPTNLTDLYNNHPIPQASRPVLVNFLGATPVANATLYQQASPVNFVTAQSVPTQIFHGSLDIINPISQSLELKAKLEAANVKVEMVTYTGEGHGWLGANLTDTYKKTVAFILQNVQ